MTKTAIQRNKPGDIVGRKRCEAMGMDGPTCLMCQDITEKGRRKLAEFARESVLSGMRQLKQAVQRVEMGREPARTVTMKNGGVSVAHWTEGTAVWAKWAGGEEIKVESPDGEVSNNGWRGALMDRLSLKSATGLHMLNAQWGGSADCLQGNIVPGSKSLNGHHKKVENLVRVAQIQLGGKVPILYYVEVEPAYERDFDYTKFRLEDGKYTIPDPNIYCGIETDHHIVLPRTPVILGSSMCVERNPFVKKPNPLRPNRVLPRQEGSKVVSATWMRWAAGKKSIVIDVYEKLFHTRDVARDVNDMLKAILELPRADIPMYAMLKKLWNILKWTI